MRRAFRSAVVGVFAITAVGAFGGVPAGDDQPVAPVEWATSVCTSLTDWATELANLSEGFERPANATPRRVKAVLVDFLGGATEVSQALLDELESAGYPDVKNGKAVARVFTSGVAQARRVFAKAERDAKKLPTASAAKFQARARLIERALDRGSEEVGSLFDEAEDRYPVPELNRAFNDEPACQELSA